MRSVGETIEQHSWLRQAAVATLVASLAFTGCSGGNETKAARTPATSISPETNAANAKKQILDQKLEELHMKQIDTFQMQSGIQATVYSDGQVTFNRADFDKAFHDSLLLADTIDEPLVPELGTYMKNLKKEVLDEKRLAGKSINVLISSNPDTCISKGKDSFISTGPGPTANQNCDTPATTLTMMSPSKDPNFGDPLIMMLLSAGSVGGNVVTHPASREFHLTAAQNFASNETHEAVHAMMRLKGVAKNQGEEQFVQTIEAEVLEHYQSGPVVRPQPVTFAA